MNPSEQRALSIHQPWADLIIGGRKTIELRRWSSDYRGLIWVHAGLVANDALLEHFQLTGAFRGGYVGVVSIAAIVPMDPERWEQWRPHHLDLGDFVPGCFAWILCSPEKFVTPLEAKGAQQLFVPHQSHVEMLHQRITVTPASV